MKLIKSFTILGVAILLVLLAQNRVNNLYNNKVVINFNSILILASSINTHFPDVSDFKIKDDFSIIKRENKISGVKKLNSLIFYNSQRHKDINPLTYTTKINSDIVIEDSLSFGPSSDSLEKWPQDFKPHYIDGNFDLDLVLANYSIRDFGIHYGHFIKHDVVATNNVSLLEERIFSGKTLVAYLEEISDENKKENNELIAENTQDMNIQQLSSSMAASIKIEPVQSGPIEPTPILGQVHKESVPVDIQSEYQVVTVQDLVNAQLKNNQLKNTNEIPEALVNTTSDVISPAVSMAIQRELKNLEHNSGQIVDTRHVMNTHKKINKGKARDFEREHLVNGSKSGLKIVANEYSLSKGEKGDLRNFEMRVGYSQSEYSNDGGSGVINIESNISHKYGVINAAIIKSSMFPTRSEFVVKKDESLVVNVPLFDEESINAFLEKEQIDSSLGIVFLDARNGIVDMDAEGEHSKKFFLNDSLMQVTINDEYEFIMIAGLAYGNTALNLTTIDGLKISKVVGLSEREIYYINGQYELPQKREVAFFEKNILSNKSVEFFVDDRKIKQYGAREKIRVAGGNYYTLPGTSLISGTREYLEMFHQNNPMLIGIDNSLEIVEVPSQEVMFVTLEKLGIQNGSFEDRCVVEVKYDLVATNVDVLGYSDGAPMNVEMYHIDENGFVTQELDGQSRSRTFLIGEGFGVFNLKIEYANSQKDYLNSFCIPNNYILELL